jgi:hypothetical protein
MAIRHHAYGFAPAAYLAALRTACVAGGAAHPEALRAHAAAIVQGADAAARMILEYLRYDDEWWHPQTIGSGVPQWLEISLIPHLRPLPSLSHLEPHSYFVLDRVLPTMGWPKADVNLLIRGESLESLPRIWGDPLLSPWFRHFRQHTGWMDRASVTRLAVALDGVEESFRHPSALQIGALADWQARSLTDRERAISAAFADATEMLRRAEKEALAVLLLFE